MKTSQAENLLINLNSLAECKGSIAFKIAYNIHKLTDELQEYVQFKQELFKKYGEEVDGQLSISKDSEHIQDFLNELKKLDVDIDVHLLKITEEELKDSNLSAKEMAMIWELYDGND